MTRYKVSILVKVLIVAFFTTFAAYVEGAESLTFYHLDALGSPVAATDEQGNVLWREEYRPFGERINNEPAASGNSRWFTGHSHDNNTGLTYMGARFYDPVVGRFMAVDPVSFSEGNIHSFNRYAYANNNPYKYVDPDGEAGILVVPKVRITPRLTRNQRPTIKVPKRLPGESQAAYGQRLSKSFGQQLRNKSGPKGPLKTGRGPVNPKSFKPQKPPIAGDGPLAAAVRLGNKLIKAIGEEIDTIGGAASSFVQPLTEREINQMKYGVDIPPYPDA